MLKKIVIFTLSIACIIVIIFFQKKSVLIPGKPYNVILISIDTCRADHIGCYGYNRRTTPIIDKLSRRSSLFRTVISPVPITLPAHSSMLTGVIPPRHGVHDNHDKKLSASQTTLAEIFQRNGYATGAVVSAYVLDSQFGLNQGFNDYFDRFSNSKKNFQLNERRAEDANKIAYQWLAAHRKGNFFFFLHYYDPHKPYSPPEPFNLLFHDNLYAGEIAYTDHCIGEILKKLRAMNLSDSTVLIITGDHGEMLGEHGEQTHMYFIYQNSLLVPLLFVFPGQSPATIFTRSVGLIDIVPTICSLFGFGVLLNVQGHDLSSFIKNKTQIFEERNLYCESLAPTQYDANPLLGVVTDNWKYIMTTKPELYNLADDPGETTNRILDHQESATRFNKHLNQLVTESKAETGADNKLNLNDEALDRLKSLGYITDSHLKENYEVDQSKEDPKDLIDFHNSFVTVKSYILKKKYAEAKKLCEKLIEQRPSLHMPYLTMAEILVEMKEIKSAIYYLKAAAQLIPREYKVYNKIGLYLAELNQFDEAIEYYTKALQLNPDHIWVNYNLASALARQARYNEALIYYEKALKIYPRLEKAYLNIGNIKVRQGKIAEALQTYQKSLHINPKQPMVLDRLAWLRAASKEARYRNPSEAVQLAKRACRLTKYKQPSLLKTLAVAYASQGRYKDATETAERAIKLADTNGQTKIAKELQDIINTLNSKNSKIR